MSFLVFVLDNSSCVYSYLEDYYERGQSKYILIELTKFEISAKVNLSAQLLAKQDWYYIYHSVFLPSFKVQCCLY